MKRQITFLLAPVVLATLAVAQSGPVSPVGFEFAEAPSSNPNPLGITDPLAHYLQIHEDLPVGALSIRGLAFRREASQLSYPAFSVDMDLLVAVPATTAAAPSATFSLNYASRFATLAVARRIVSFPRTGPSTFLPQAFDYPVIFDAPYSLSGGRICWEARIFGRSNALQVDFDQVPVGTGDANPGLARLRFGEGCRATGGTLPFTAQAFFNTNWAGGSVQVGFGGVNGPANSNAIAAIGFDNAQWAGLPLPIELPGSALGASGSCKVYNDVLTTMSGTTSSSGVFSSPFITLPLYAGLSGVTLFHQVWAFDSGANTFGIVTSDALGHQIVEPYSTPAVGLVGARGSIATIGFVNTGAGLVTRFLQ